MKRISYLTIIIIQLLLLLESCGNFPKADLVLQNGLIYTVDSKGSTAEAVVIKEDKIIFVGNKEGIKNYIGQSTTVIDLQGRIILPGFIDSHAHPISSVKQLFDVDLYGLENITSIQEAISEFRNQHLDADFIRGRGWSNTLFPKEGPDKKYLDEIINDIPVILSSEDGHSKWLNSKALEIAEINNNSKDPSGGVIERYHGTNEPNGTLRENASDLANEIVPYYSLQELVAGLETYQEMALAFGITTVHDAYLDFDVDEITAYKQLENENKINMRFRASLYIDPTLGTNQVKRLITERGKHGSDLFKINSAKLFIDGVVEGTTALLKEPYNHIPNFYGQMLWNLDSLNNICTELEKNNFQIHVHAIGDSALSATLNAFEFSKNESGKKDLRHSITHLQLASMEDIVRFRELGVIAVPQPYWFKKDSYYTDIQVPYLGQKRADKEYPMASFFSEGVVVASSSDYPVTIPCNPFIAVQTGITRSEPNNSEPTNILWPEESVTLEQMIASFTINGAYANFVEQLTGSIEVGKSADLIVIDSDLFNIPVYKISKTKVLQTIFKGKEVFRDSSYIPLIL